MRTRTRAVSGGRTVTDRLAVSGPLYLQMSEAEFTTTVVELATVLGWRIAHVRAARTKDGWRTPYQGHSGLPDLILARRGRVILAELKVGDNKPTLDQQAWLSAAGTSGHLWFPADMDEIKATLQ